MLKLKKRDATKELKKVLIYGMDGSGKSTFAENYCEKHNLNPVCIDIDDTNFTNVPIVDLDLSTDIKTYRNISKTIKEICNTEYDTIIIDGVSSLLELLTSEAKGMKAYKDRADRFNKILRDLMKSQRNLIFIGQADMKVLYSDDAQSPKPIIKINSIVNEKYLTYQENNIYKAKVEKLRGMEKPAHDIAVGRGA